MKTSSTATQKTTFGCGLLTPRPVFSRIRYTSQITCNAKRSQETSSMGSAFAVSTSMLLAAVAPVQASEEVAQLAAQDNRLGAVFLLFLPAVAWVLFNITGPASRQLEAMSEGKPKAATPKSSGRAPPAKKPAPAKRAPAKKPAPAKKAPPQKAPAKKGGLNIPFFGKN